MPATPRRLPAAGYPLPATPFRLPPAATSFRYPLPPALGADARGRAAGGRQGVAGQLPCRFPLQGIKKSMAIPPISLPTFYKNEK